MRTYVLYRLGGESRQAAMRTGYILHAAIEKNPIAANSYEEFVSVKRLFNEKACAALQKNSPELLDEIGMNTPAIQVFSFGPGTYRAYTNYPQIYLMPGNQQDVFMYCPVDYKGEHFSPKDATVLNEEETKLVAPLLFSKGWTANQPLLEKQEECVVLPADFEPQKSIIIPDGGEFQNENVKIYKANARSLDVVNDFLKRRQEQQESAQRLLNFVGVKTSEANKDSKDKDHLQADIRMGHDKEGKPHVFVTLFKTGAADPGDNGVVAPTDNETFKVKERYAEGFKVEPNEETETGREFKKLLGNVSAPPRLSSYWQLYNPTAPAPRNEQEKKAGVDHKVPYLRTIAGEHYLVYIVDPAREKDASCPPDGIPVSKAEYFLARQDEIDASMGVKLPPRPASFKPA